MSSSEGLTGGEPTPRLIQGAGTIRFLAAAGLRGLASCWLSAGGGLNTWRLTAVPHTATCLGEPARRHSSEGTP